MTFVTRYAAFVQGARDSLPKPIPVTPENLHQVFSGAPVEVSSNGRYVNHIGSDFTFRHIGIFPLAVRYFGGLQADKKRLFYEPLLASAEGGVYPTADNLMSFTGLTPVEFVLPEEIVTLPVPPWVNPTCGSQFCFRSEYNEILADWITSLDLAR